MSVPAHRGIAGYGPESSSTAVVEGLFLLDVAFADAPERYLSIRWNFAHVCVLATLAASRPARRAWSTP